MEHHRSIEDGGLSELIGRAEPGDELVIVRNGRELARVTVAAPIDQIAQNRALRMEGLRRFAATRAALGINIDGAALVREMRDAGY